MNRLARPVVALFALLALAVPLAGCNQLEKAEDKVFDAGLALEHWRAGLKPVKLHVDDIDWVYLKNDWKPGQDTVVLLHGFSGDKDNWTRFAGALGAGYNVVIPDLPGHGQTTQVMNLAYDVDTQSRRVLSLMTALGVDQFHLAGNSMGGAIALHTAWLAPGRVRTLGLFDPAGGHLEDSDFDVELRKGHNPLIVREPSDLATVVKFAMAKPPFMPWPTMEVMGRRSMARAALNEKIFADLVRDNDIDQTREGPEVVARTLVLWGTEDRLLNVANADLFVSMMPNATKLLMPGLGHLPMLEAPEDSAQAYRDFLAKIVDGDHRPAGG